METMNEMIPFAKEMFLQSPSRGMVKMYMLGTTLAFFGVVGGLVETVCLPFAEREPVEEEEEEEEEEVTEKGSHTATTTPEPRAVEVVQTEVLWVKAKPLREEGQRGVLIRSHAR